MSKTADGEAVPRPPDDPDQHLAGPDPLEVRLIGSGAASGWGVLSHSLGLSGALARSLRAGTERGVVLRSDIDPAHTARSAAEAIRTSGAPLDGLRIAVVGVNETLDMRRPDLWRADVDALLDAFDPSEEHPVVVAGIQPISSIPLFAGGLSGWLDRHAQLLNAQTLEACARRAHTVFAPLSAPPRGGSARYRGPADYDFWATEIARTAIPLLPAPATASGGARDAHMEYLRQGELARLGIDRLRDSFALNDVVHVARTIFDTESAAVLILDQDRAWMISSEGTDITEVRRDNSFTSYAVESGDGFVVPDARDDERFRDYAYVTGEPYVRFFAAHPIEGATGQRIGVLCVYDSRPRTFDEPSRALLRDLARRAQDSLQRGAA